jgi:hypothetical protein
VLQKAEFLKLKCPKCYAETDAACDCGVAYVSPFDLAAQAVKADPEKSKQGNRGRDWSELRNRAASPQSN